MVSANQHQIPWKPIHFETSKPTVSTNQASSNRPQGVIPTILILFLGHIIQNTEMGHTGYFLVLQNALYLGMYRVLGIVQLVFSVIVLHHLLTIPTKQHQETQ